MTTDDDYAARYRQHFSRMTGPEAHAQAIGDHFDDFGPLMSDILREAGLRETDYLVDVGCGSGRLAHALSIDRYLGIDVVPKLLEHARSLCPHPAWRFELVDRIAIPERDGAADMVCFFSVFTHLLHEDSFRYLREARRVLRPGGKAVVSFLEFRAGNHWIVFEAMVRARDLGNETIHNQFLDRDGIQIWADHAGFSIEGIFDGVTHPLGQSVCILLAG